MALRPNSCDRRGTKIGTMPDLTDRQQAILDFVRERIAVEGMPPTWAEIARAFGFRQTRAAQKHLQALEAKGYLTLLPGKARGIRLPASQANSSEQRRLPILGRVAAGLPIGADIGSEDVVILDRVLFSPAPDYLLKVQGDSMRDEGIFDGDLIGVHRTREARSGQIVVARIEEEITVKLLKIGKDRIRLLPRNPDYALIDVLPDQDFAIEGVYCGLIRED